MEVRKRRAEGTPCNKENFDAWKAQFDAEMAALAESSGDKDDGNKAGMKKVKKQGISTVDKSDRMTGFDFFRSKATNMEALEAAAEAAENQAMEDDDDIDGGEDEGEEQQQLDVDEDLFEDDVDLDDLDFDSDDDKDEDVDI